MYSVYTHFAFWATFAQRLVRLHHHRRVLVTASDGGQPVWTVIRLMRGQVVERGEFHTARRAYELDDGRFQLNGRRADAVFGRLRRTHGQGPARRAGRPFRARFAVRDVVRVDDVLLQRRYGARSAVVFFMRQKVLVLAKHYVAALALGRHLFQEELMRQRVTLHGAAAADFRHRRVQSQGHFRR